MVRYLWVGDSYWGVPVFAGAVLIPHLNGYLVVEAQSDALKAGILLLIGINANIINTQLNGSNELMLATVGPIINGSATLEWLTTPKFSQQCGPNCNPVFPAMINAALKCQDGVDLMQDYRGVTVLVAYVCIPEINTGTRNLKLIQLIGRTLLCFS